MTRASGRFGSEVTTARGSSPSKPFKIRIALLPQAAVPDPALIMRRVESEQPQLVRGNRLKIVVGAGVGVVIAVIAKSLVGREGMSAFVVVGLIVLALILAFWAYSWWYVTKTERGRAVWAEHAERKRERT